MTDIVERLRNDAYALPSCGPWIERDGSTLPNNSCSQAADEIDSLRSRVAKLTEALDSVRQYGSDTLSGRTDGPNDRAWQRAAVREMTRRASVALGQSTRQALASVPSADTTEPASRSQKMVDSGFTRRPSLWSMQARETLELIASPMRPDGTWNRDREACRQLAAEALGHDADTTERP